MNILLLGALSWNPERVLALSDKGHRLYGLWSRTMAWEQGPYSFAGGAITELDIEGAIDLLHDGTIDIVYSLFQVYDSQFWARDAAPGVGDLWVQLRRLLHERSRSAFDAPIVRHWGFDVHNLDLEVVRALDGQIFCNRHNLNYWTTPRKAGGCGLDLGCKGQEIAFMDSDLPSREFMTDRFTPKLSAGSGEIHTVCVGRPLGIDLVSAARHGIHVHIYGNNFDDVASMIARGLSPFDFVHVRGLLADYVHIHPPIQPADSTLQAIRSAKSRWVEEFSRYDAGWSYVGRPFPWPRLQDEAAIPNRLSTYLLAGLPIIAETLPGFYRYDSIAEYGVAIDFSPSDYAALALDLRRTDTLAGMNETARLVRERFTFEATIDSLIGYFERVREQNDRRHRSDSVAGRCEKIGTVTSAVRPVVGRPQQLDILAHRGRLRAKQFLGRVFADDYVFWALHRSRAGQSREEPSGFTEACDGKALDIAVIERFPASSRNCDLDELAAAGGDVQILRLGGDERLMRPNGRRVVSRELARRAALPWRCLLSLVRIMADSGLSARDKRSLIASALATRGAPFASLGGAYDAVRLLRSKRFDRIDCFSARGFALTPMLSELFDVPYREFLARGTRYFGEFAFELLAVVPYAYWLHREGRLQVTQSCKDTGCLYYFSPNHQELANRRTYVPVSEYPSTRTSSTQFDFHGFSEHLDTSQWIPPPYKSIFANETFQWPKPLCIISNKYTPEPSVSSGEAVNFIPVAVLMELLELLQERYQVVYVRPRSGDIVGDHQPIGDLGDLAAISSRFPDVLTIQQIHAGHPELSFNELQMNLFANCERFVSVLGGSAYLSSYFGGKNIVYAREGSEVSCNAYNNWFHLFSGAQVFQAATLNQLLELVRREIVP